jgi:hypothetical protein
MCDFRDLLHSIAGARDPWQDLLLLVLWFFVTPPAAALIADDIVNEKIGQSLTAWVDRRFRGSLIGYLFRCHRCLSHWSVFVMWLLYAPIWATLPFTLYVNFVISIISLITTIRYTRGWLEDD